MNTVVILAGGKSRRMGRDKLGLTFGSVTLLESVAARFSACFENVYLSVSDLTKYPEITLRHIADIIPGAGPLSGLHAALSALPDGDVFLVAADLPFASPAAAKRIIGLCGNCSACVIKLDDGRLEPLFGFYRNTLLPYCTEALKSGDFRMSGLLYGADTRFVSPHELGELWDEKLLLNVNYPADYEKILKLG